MRSLHCANRKPDSTVVVITTTITTPLPNPSAAMSPKATRKPSSATAQRSTVRTQNANPACVHDRAAIGLSAIPITKAITIFGIGTIRAT